MLDPKHKRELIVIGLGRFGTSLAMTLDVYGHDVLAVDADMKRVQTVGQRLPHVIQIDATDIDALREVGAELFDTAVVCIGSDFESNLLAAVSLRKLGARRVVAKARTVTNRKFCCGCGSMRWCCRNTKPGCGWGGAYRPLILSISWNSAMIWWWWKWSRPLNLPIKA